MWKSSEISQIYCNGIYFDNDQPNVWLRIKNGKIETSKGIKITQTEAERLWGLIKVFHDGGQFKHDLVLDVTGQRWAFNCYENDMLTAGCHRIAYSEMEGVARQLGTEETSKMSWVALPVEPACMGRRSGKTKRSPCSLAWLSNKVTYKYVRKYEY